MAFKLAPLNHSHIVEVTVIEQGTHLSPWSENTIRQSFGPRSHNVGIFSVDGQQWALVGYYFADHVAGELSLENICISSAYQGKGLANRLMLDLMTHAESINAIEVWLEVRESNESAVALYQKFGFDTVSVRKDYYTIPGTNKKEHALLMKKDLHSST